MLFTGTCHTKTDRESIARGFLPHKDAKNSLQSLDNLIECGLPCFNQDGKEVKDLPESFAPDCCPCCEAKNKFYEAEIFSSYDCGDCVRNFIEKSYVDPSIQKCVDGKNKKNNIPMGILQMEYNCYVCQPDNEISKLKSCYL